MKNGVKQAWFFDAYLTVEVLLQQQDGYPLWVSHFQMTA